MSVVGVRPGGVQHVCAAWDRMRTIFFAGRLFKMLPAKTYCVGNERPCVLVFGVLNRPPAVFMIDDSTGSAGTSCLFGYYCMIFV